MTHAVSVTYTRFDHMSPSAAMLAGLLHALVALALWWVSPLNHRDLEVEPIEVTMEEPTTKAPETATQQAPAPQPNPSAPTPPTAQPAPPPATPTTPPPPPVAPPAAKVTPPAQPQMPLGLKQPPAKSEAKQPETPKQETPPPPPPSETQQASRPQEPTRPPQPPLQDVLPPLETPPPPITSQDFPKAPPKPPAPPKQQQTHIAPEPGAPSGQHQQRLTPSPLSQHQNPTQQATAPSTTFVNPADTYVRTKSRDDYLWQVIGKFSQYLPRLYQANQGGTVVLSFSIARDGRLLDASITKSSGVVALDRGLLEAIRVASPYPPLPADIPGDRVTYVQAISARQ